MSGSFRNPMFFRRSSLNAAVAKVMFVAAAAMVIAQPPFGGGPGRGGRGGGYGGGYSGFHISDISGAPTWFERKGMDVWEVDQQFKKDLFTFVRIEYDSGRYGGGGRGGSWRTDAPDSDLNFSLRLQQLTSLKVNPEPIVLRLTDPRLFDYPFIYIIEPGSLSFSEEEVKALRQYCLNGGFLMIDDFWGDSAWENMRLQLKRAFPERDTPEVPLEHEIFHCVYDLKEKPQMPAVRRWNASRPNMTWEPSWDGSDTSVVHFRAIYDDAGRIMVFICHNTDLGDGWEKEGDNIDYFEQMSVKKAYPMGINIVTYAMTH